MSNALRYVKDLEAAGFQRSQAEAQVQMVLDAIEGELVTKSDFAVLRNDFALLKNDFSSIKEHVDNRFSLVDSQIKEAQFKTVATLATFGVGLVSIAVALLAWLIKV
jgi:regulator of sigma D